MPARPVRTGTAVAPDPASRAILVPHAAVGGSAARTPARRGVARPTRRDLTARLATHVDARVTNTTVTTNTAAAPAPTVRASIRTPGAVSMARARPIGVSGDA